MGWLANRSFSEGWRRGWDLNPRFEPESLMISRGINISENVWKTSNLISATCTSPTLLLDSALWFWPYPNPIPFPIQWTQKSRLSQKAMLLRLIRQLQNEVSPSRKVDRKPLDPPSSVSCETCVIPSFFVIFSHWLPNPICGKKSTDPKEGSSACHEAYFCHYPSW